MAQYWEMVDRSQLPSQFLDDQRMVWAMDGDTDLLIHVGELPASRRGKASGCTCCHCNAPLTAVNAAKLASDRRRRPHFRHPAGTERDSCMIVSARHAAMMLLLEHGEIDLPGRRATVSIRGVSGYQYEGVAEKGSQRWRIKDVQFLDITKATLLLDDGRHLLVYLVAEEASVEEGGQAAIRVVLDDPNLATLPREELRQRIRLSLDNATWVSCWPEDIAAANESAVEQASNEFDWWGDFSDNTPPELRGETLLHRMAKSILASSRCLRVPALTLIEADVADGVPCAYMNEQPIKVDTVVLEKKVGALRPDLIASLPNHHFIGPNLLIEITVTNPISDERLCKIRELNLPCLEIDLRGFSGRVSIDQMAKILCDSVEGKLWVHHPRLYTHPVGNLSEQALAYENLDTRAWRDQISGMSAEQVAASWLSAWLAEEEARGSLEAKQSLAQWERAMKMKEIPFDIMHEPHGRSLIKRLHRILHLHQNGRTGPKDLGQLAMHICSDVTPQSKRFRPLYMGMLKHYPALLSDSQRNQFDSMCTLVRSEVRGDRKSMYFWPIYYDRLLVLLFPKLEETIKFMRIKEYSSMRSGYLNQTIPTHTVKPSHSPKRHDPDAYRRAKGLGDSGLHRKEATDFPSQKDAQLFSGSNHAKMNGQSPIKFAELYELTTGQSVRDTLKVLYTNGLAHNSTTWR